eukprot:13581453-Alexandrium_andersonii.AAC.1
MSQYDCKQLSVKANRKCSEILETGSVLGGFRAASHRSIAREGETRLFLDMYHSDPPTAWRSEGRKTRQPECRLAMQP